MRRNRWNWRGKLGRLSTTREPWRSDASDKLARACVLVLSVMEDLRLLAI